MVVELLQDIFTTFDAICEQHDVMKIKTIGDSYMAVAFGTANVMPSGVEAQRTANVMPSGRGSEQRTSCRAESRHSEQRTASVMPSGACPAEGRIEAQ
ncbi:MAG: hypothetical protein IPM83_03255 [Ignavibacteria bacterium]|nr:hypothetical protein [Ignavibacteria bacterium]